MISQCLSPHINASNLYLLEHILHLWRIREGTYFYWEVSKKIYLFRNLRIYLAIWAFWAVSSTYFKNVIWKLWFSQIQIYKQGIIHVLRNHVLGFSDLPPLPFVITFSTERNQNLPFCDPPPFPPLLWQRNTWMIPKANVVPSLVKT